MHPDMNMCTHSYIQYIYTHTHTHTHTHTLCTCTCTCAGTHIQTCNPLCSEFLPSCLFLLFTEHLTISCMLLQLLLPETRKHPTLPGATVLLLVHGECGIQFKLKCPPPPHTHTHRLPPTPQPTTLSERQLFETIYQI